MKARCKKIGLFWVLELKRFNSTWKVVNLDIHNKYKGVTIWKTANL